jgi:hypothetical protein
MSSFPTLVLPVKLIFRTVGDSQSVEPTEGVFAKDVTTLKTPGGIPALWLSSASAFAVRGVSLGDLATIEHPAAMAGPILRVSIAAGKFHLLS